MVKDIAKQIAQALEHLHSRGIIHADLKPLNTMEADGRWKLIDLDAAVSYRHSEPAGLKSSTGFVPPELLCVDQDGKARVRDPNKFQTDALGIEAAAPADNNDSAGHNYLRSDTVKDPMVPAESDTKLLRDTTFLMRVQPPGGEVLRGVNEFCEPYIDLPWDIGDQLWIGTGVTAEPLGVITQFLTVGDKGALEVAYCPNRTPGVPLTHTHPINQPLYVLQTCDVDLLEADPSFDMWSFGVLLYLLITGQTLFNNDQEDNLDDGDLLRLCKWNDDSLKAALAKVHNPRRGKNQPLGRDLLEKLLQPDPARRCMSKDHPLYVERKALQNFDDVLSHPFFAEDSNPVDRSNTVDLASLEIINALDKKMDLMLKSQARQEKLLAVIDERTIKIEAVSDKTYIQLRKTENVLLRGMFEATEVTRPTSFIITPNLIEEEAQAEDGAALSIGADGDICLAAGGAGVELGERGAELKAKAEKGKRWLSTICNLGSKIASGSGRLPAVGLGQQVKEQMTVFVTGKLHDEAMYLYLIDEYTGELVSTYGDPYPIKITTPSEHAKWLLPVMRTGLKLMAVVNSAALVGSIFGLPLPRVPGALREQAYSAVGKVQ
jgi:serine/threonine protein kinase